MDIPAEEAGEPIHILNLTMLINITFPGTVNVAIPIAVAFLTIPTLKSLLVRKRSFARDYEPIDEDVADTAYYQDRNGEATEASTKAFGTLRSMLMLRLGVLMNLGASITVRLIANSGLQISTAISAQQSKVDTVSSWGEIVLAVCNHFIHISNSWKAIGNQRI